MMLFRRARSARTEFVNSGGRSPEPVRDCGCSRLIRELNRTRNRQGAGRYSSVDGGETGLNPGAGCFVRLGSRPAQAGIAGTMEQSKRQQGGGRIVTVAG